MAESSDDGRHQNDKQPVSLGSIGMSEELIDPWCDPCYDDFDRKVEALSFCSNCNAFFCKACDDDHSRLPSSRNHRALRSSNMPGTQALKPVNYLHCGVHSAFVKDEYCFNHFEMLCSLCASSHGNCTVKHISAVCQNISIGDVDCYKLEIKCIREMLHTFRTSLEKNVNNINNRRDSFIEGVEKLRNKIFATTDRLCSEMKTEIKQMCLQKRSDQLDKISTFSQTIDELDKILHEIEKAGKHELDENTFLRLQDTVERSQRCMGGIEACGRQTEIIDLSFSPNPLLSEIFSDLKTMGNVKETRSKIGFVEPMPVITFPCQSRTQIKAIKASSFNVKTDTDKLTCHIQGMDVTSGGLILLADSENRKVKAISHDHKMITSVKLTDNPLDISIIDNETAAVVTDKKKLKILEITDLAAISVKRTHELGFLATSSTSYNNKLIVTAKDIQRSVKMIDLFGKELWSVSTNQMGHSLFKEHWSLARGVHEGEPVVLVSDRNKSTVNIFDINHGNHIKTIDVSNKNPLGLTVDTLGNIYICYSKTNDICVWSANMEHSRGLLSGNDLRPHVFCIMHNKVTDELIVSYVDSDILDVFQISH